MNWSAAGGALGFQYTINRETNYSRRLYRFRAPPAPSAPPAVHQLLALLALLILPRCEFTNPTQI